MIPLPTQNAKWQQRQTRREQARVASAEKEEEADLGGIPRLGSRGRDFQIGMHQRGVRSRVRNTQGRERKGTRKDETDRLVDQEMSEKRMTLPLVELLCGWQDGKLAALSLSLTRRERHCE